MVIFVNCFTVPAGREDEFLALWGVVNIHMAAKPGYVDHALHRSLDPNAAYRFVNVAHWTSKDTWVAAHDAQFRALVQAPEWRDFASLPGLYDDEPARSGSKADTDMDGARPV